MHNYIYYICNYALDFVHFDLLLYWVFMYDYDHWLE